MPSRGRRDRAYDIATDGKGPNFTVSVPGKRTDQILLASVTLQAGNAWTVSDPIDVARCRKLHLWLYYQAGALNGQFGIIPEVHGGPRGDAPVSLGTNSWYPLSRASSSAGTISAVTAPTNALYTGQSVEQEVVYPLLIKGAVCASGEKQALVVTLDVECAQEFRVQCSERSAVAPGILEIRYTKSV